MSRPLETTSELAPIVATENPDATTQESGDSTTEPDVVIEVTEDPRLLECGQKLDHANKVIVDLKKENESNLDRIGDLNRKLKAKESALEEKKNELERKKKEWESSVIDERNRKEQMVQEIQQKLEEERRKWNEQLRQKHSQFDSLKQIFDEIKEKKKEELNEANDELTRKMEAEQDRMREMMEALGMGTYSGQELMKMVNHQRSSLEAKYATPEGVAMFQEGIIPANKVQGSPLLQ